jgi:epoxide hydrolase-like predicted phosphatase
MIKAIIFDYYGVIQPDVLYATYRHFGGDPERDERFISDTIRALNKGDIPSSWPVFAQRLGVQVEKWGRALEERGKRDPELLAYILSLRKQGYKTALLSNVGAGGLQQLWPSGEIEKYFDTAVSSGDVGHVKPDPEIFYLTAQRLDVLPEECVMIDDRPDYCDGARTAGMQTIAYRHVEQCKQELEKLLREDT